MLKKLTQYYFVLFILFLIVFLRFNELLATFIMSINIIGSLDLAFLIKYEVLDQLLSLLAFVLTIVILFLFGKRSKWLAQKLELKNAGLIVLLFIFLFAPLLAPFNHTLQLNLPECKNLTPFTSKHLIENNLDEHSKLFREYSDDKYFIVDDKIANKENRSSKTVIFLFGTDEFGRDILSRLIFAIRYSMFISVAAIMLSSLLGIPLGFISGYLGKAPDIILNRITEMFLAVPYIFLVILLVAIAGDSILTVIAVLGLAGWMSLFKVVRGEVKKLKNKDHIVTARMIGMKLTKQLRKEYLPLLLPSIVVNVTFQFAYILVAESSLSFLGITGNYEQPSLGSMVHYGFEVVREEWWQLAIALITIAFVFYVTSEHANHFYNKYTNKVEK